MSRSMLYVRDIQTMLDTCANCHETFAEGEYGLLTSVGALCAVCVHKMYTTMMQEHTKNDNKDVQHEESAHVQED